MFKRIGNLTYNELIKQFKKKSTIAMTSLILTSAIVAPLVVGQIDKANNDSANSLVGIVLSGDVNEEKSQKNILNENKSDKEKVQQLNSKIASEYEKFLSDNKVSYSDWKKDITQKYETAMYDQLVLELVISGVNQKVIEKNVNSVDTSKLQSYEGMSKIQLESELAKAKNETEKYKTIIEKEDYLSYLSVKIAQENEYLKEQTLSVKELESQVEKNSSNKDLKLQLDSMNDSIAMTKASIELDKFRFDNKIDFSDSNWKNRALISLRKSYEKLNITMLDEKEFAQQAGTQSIVMSYEEYQKQFKENKIREKENIDKVWYSLKNNAPQFNDIMDARKSVDSLYEVYMMIAVLMVIIIGGGIVSTEFSTGSIRLLMIRPVSRWKVLLSKFLALLIIGFGILVGSTLILIISSGFIYGFGTFGTPVLSVIGGKVIETAYFSYMIKNLLISSASLVFIASLVFMISTVIKNTAVAVAISLVLYLGALPITMGLAQMKLNFVTQTILPYINQSMFNIAPFFKEILMTRNGIGLNPMIGVTQLLIASAVMLAITFIVFIKRDIKN